MQRQLCIKLLSKTLREYNSISVRTSFTSSFSKANANPLHHQSCSRLFSTQSNSYLWKNFGFRTGFSGFVQNGLLRQALVKGRTGFSNDGALWFKSGRFFHSSDPKYRGWKSLFRRLTTDGVVLGLIATNVAVFILWRVADPHFMVKNFMIGRSGGPLYLLNMYISGAIIGSFYYLIHHIIMAKGFPPYFKKESFQGNQTVGIDPWKIPGHGASGGLYTIMLLHLFLFPSKPLCFDFLIPIPAVLLGIFIIGEDVRRITGDDQVSPSTHLGGATTAAVASLAIFTRLRGF